MVEKFHRNLESVDIFYEVQYPPGPVSRRKSKTSSILVDVLSLLPPVTSYSYVPENNFIIILKVLLLSFRNSVRAPRKIHDPNGVGASKRGYYDPDRRS